MTFIPQNEDGVKNEGNAIGKPEEILSTVHLSGRGNKSKIGCINIV